MSVMLFVLIILSSAFSLSTDKGSVWSEHVRIGALLVQGKVTETPAYPMWGYSLIGGLLKDFITLLVQAISLCAIVVFWYSYLLRLDIENKWLKTLRSPFVFLLLMLPWISLATSFYSNSIVCILVFTGTWLLYESIAANRFSILKAASCGLLFGIAINVRTEIIILVALLGFFMMIYGLKRDDRKFFIIKIFVTVIISYLSLIPWMIYTSNTVGHPLLTSTNSGAVRYIGLGIVKNNPWNIIPKDEFVEEIARKELGKSAWSYEADIMFSEKYNSAVQSNPAAFMKRVAAGWMHIFLKGVYFPDLKELANSDSVEAKKLEFVDDYFREKLTLGITNKPEVYRAYGISFQEISAKYFLIVAGDYLLRIIFLTAFIILFIASIIKLFKGKGNLLFRFILLSYILFVLFVAGFIQTSSRHTTILLPVIFSAVLLIENKKIKV